MKRILSLLVVLAMVIAMVPSVFAAKESIDMDELLGKLVYLDSIDAIDVAMAEGDGTKTFKWTPEKDGILTLYVYTWDLPEGVTIDVTMTQGENSITYSETEDAFQLEVVGGEEVSIVVAKTGEAALEDYTIDGNFMDPLGSEGNPIALSELVNEVEVEDATWFQTYMSGTTMTVAGEGDFTVTVNGEATAAENGAVTMPVATPNPRMPFLFTIDQAGAYTITFVYPVGNQMNPAQLVIGENTATVEAGSQGYYYNWTAEANGKLTITMPEGNWFCVVNNMTSYVYGDWQYSDNDPAVPSTTIDVKAGDLIEVQVNTYDPENPWGAPAGSITFTAAFEEVTYTPGDLDGNETVDEDDVIYLLQHLLMPGDFAVDQPVDYDKSGTIDEDDVIYLLQHLLMPGDFPLV